MKRLLLIFFSSLVLCSCAVTRPNVCVTNTVTEPETSISSEPSTITEMENCDTPGTWGEFPLVKSNIDVEVVDGDGMIPLLFIVTDIYMDRAYLLTAGKDGNVYLAEQFKYDGKPLYSDFLYEGRMMLKDEPATTPIMEEDRKLFFLNSHGESFTSDHQGVTTTGMRGVYYIFAHVHLPEDTVLTDRLYIGSYADAYMFPENATYEDNRIIADLDRNGVQDQITWEMRKNKPFDFPLANYSDYLYDYTVSIERNGATYTIINAPGDTVGKDDMQVFVADADQDGEFEVIVFEKVNLNFTSVMLYDFDGTAYVMRRACPITMMP